MIARIAGCHVMSTRTELNRCRLLMLSASFLTKLITAALLQQKKVVRKRLCLQDAFYTAKVAVVVQLDTNFIKLQYTLQTTYCANTLPCAVIAMTDIAMTDSSIALLCFK
jgi:hypothetical protein